MSFEPMWYKISNSEIDEIVHMLAEQSRGDFFVVRENKEKNKEEGENDITKHVRVFMSDILHRNGKLNRSQSFIWKNGNHKTKRKEKIPRA